MQINTVTAATAAPGEGGGEGGCWAQMELTDA